MITSTANEKIKRVAAFQQKAKLRQEAGVFIAEGLRLFEEAPLSLIEEVYVSEGFLRDYKNASPYKGSSSGQGASRIPAVKISDFYMKLTGKLEQAGYEEVSEQVFQKMSDTTSPQGILAVLRQQKYERKDLLGKRPLLLLLENIQDPGNMGTIFRAAEGAGVTGIVMSRDCVDLYHPKVVRSAMGSIFRLPFLVAEDLRQEIKLLQKDGIKVFAAHLDGERFYDEEDYGGGTAFLIGNEANGLRAGTAGEADALVKIPMLGKLESLNAGVSAALLAYEAARQRRRQ